MTMKEEFLARAITKGSVKFRTPDDDYRLYANQDGNGWSLEIIDDCMICLAPDLEEALYCIENISAFDYLEMLE